MRKIVKLYCVVVVIVAVIVVAVCVALRWLSGGTSEWISAPKICEDGLNDERVSCMRGRVMMWGWVVIRGCLC